MGGSHSREQMMSAIYIEQRDLKFTNAEAKKRFRDDFAKVEHSKPLWEAISSLFHHLDNYTCFHAGNPAVDVDLAINSWVRYDKRESMIAGAVSDIQSSGDSHRRGQRGNLYNVFLATLKGTNLYQVAVHSLYVNWKTSHAASSGNFDGMEFCRSAIKSYLESHLVVVHISFEDMETTIASAKERHAFTSLVRPQKEFGFTSAHAREKLLKQWVCFARTLSSARNGVETTENLADAFVKRLKRGLIDPKLAEPAKVVVPCYKQGSEEERVHSALAEATGMTMIGSTSGQNEFLWFQHELRCRCKQKVLEEWRSPLYVCWKRQLAERIPYNEEDKNRMMDEFLSAHFS